MGEVAGAEVVLTAHQGRGQGASPLLSSMKLLPKQRPENTKTMQGKGIRHQVLHK